MPDQWLETKTGQRWISRYVATRRRGWQRDQAKAYLVELGLQPAWANHVANRGDAVLEQGTLDVVLPLTKGMDNAA